MRFRSPFLSDLIALLAPQRRLVKAVVVAMLIDVAFQALLPVSLKFLIDRAIVPRDAQLLYLLLAVLCIGLVIAALAMIWRDLLYARLGAAVLRNVRQRLFEHLQGLPLSYYASMRPGDLMARFSTDLASVEQLVVGGLPSVFIASLTLFVLGLALLALDSRLFLLVAMLMPLCWLGPRLVVPRAAALGLEARRREADLLSVLQEQLEGQAAVKALGLERHAVERVTDLLTATQSSVRRFNFQSYLAERLPNIAMLVVHVAALACGALLAFSGRMSVGTLVAFNAVLLSLGNAMATLTSSSSAFLSAAAGLRRIREVLDVNPTLRDLPEACGLPCFGDRIVFEDVSFAHGNAPVLHGLNLEIERGQAVAFVGPSGSGKSTILGLIARFHDPVTGRILLDGMDLRAYRLESLRALLGIVQQDTMIFAGSLRENIRLGRLDALDAEVEHAALQSQVDDFVRNLPEGYETRLGPGGTHLSGGQRQRISIARAILRRPQILLLDEATSALDPATERAVNNALESLRGQLTTIRVTHRLAEAAAYDRIFVLEGGLLAEQGTHGELLEADGLYASLWRKQTGLQLSDDSGHAQVTAAFLGEWPLFQGMDADLMEDVCRSFLSERVASGAVILREGELGDRFYVVVRGTVSVRRRGAHDQDREIARLREGEVFGESALLSERPRNATVVALTPCVLLSLGRERFRSWVGRDPAWRRQLEELQALR